MMAMMLGLLGVCTWYAEMVIRIQMTFSQPAYYSEHFLAFNWGGKETKERMCGGYCRSVWRRKEPLETQIVGPHKL